jgi:hypothetical protein
MIAFFITVYTSLSMFFQYYLFYLIVWVSPKNMEEYRFFIFLLTV